MTDRWKTCVYIPFLHLSLSPPPHPPHPPPSPVGSVSLEKAIWCNSLKASPPPHCLSLPLSPPPLPPAASSGGCGHHLQLRAPPRNMTAHNHAHNTPGASTKEMEDRRLVSWNTSSSPLAGPQGAPWAPVQPEGPEHQRGREEATSRVALGSLRPSQKTASAPRPHPGTFPCGVLLL